MCGILGIVLGRDAVMSSKVLHTIGDRLFLLSESRGKESSGTAILDEHAIHLLKIPYPASWMIRSDKYQSLIARIFSNIAFNFN